MQKKKNKQSTAISPQAWEFVLVKDEKGEFVYYYKGQFYTHDQVSNLLSPKEIKKLEKKEVEIKKEEAIVKPAEEIPPDLRELEQQFLKKFANKAIEQSKIDIQSADRNKLIQIVISRFRGIRKDVELKYILTASISAGGIGFDDQRAEKLISKIKELLPEFERKRVEVLREGQMPADLKAVPVQIKAPAPAPVVARKRLSGLDKKKPVVTDLTLGVSLTGPVDELRTMDLVNLRRLGINKEEIVSEIMERIDLLAEQSIQKKVAGIAAWQQSPVYQRYLNIGFQSISQNKPVENIINEGIAKKEKGLTFEEFQAIMEVNGKLQF